VSQNQYFYHHELFPRPTLTEVTWLTHKIYIFIAYSIGRDGGILVNITKEGKTNW